MAKLVYTDPSGRELTVPFGPDSPLVSIGRATDCTIRSNRKSVSRRHAEFHFVNGRYEVRDLGSSNGTYIIIDDQRQPIRNPQPLSHNDEVWCGDFILRFYAEDDESTGAFDQSHIYGNQGGVSGGMHSNYPQQQPPSPPSHQSANLVSGGVSAGGMQGGGPQGPSSNYDNPGYDNNSSYDSPGYDNSPGGYSGQYSQAPPPSPSPPAPPQGGNNYPSYANDPGPGVGGHDDGKHEQELQRLRDEKKSIQELADRQSREVEQLRGELEQVRSEIEQARSDSRRHEDQVGQLRGELEQARQDARQHEEHIAKQTRELESLRDELNMARTNTVDSTALHSMESQLDEALAEQNRLREALELSRQSSGDAEDRLEAATAKIDELQGQLDRTQSDARRDLVAMEERVVELESTLSARDGHVNDLKDQLEERQQDLELLESELKRTQQSLKRAEENSSDQEELEQLRSEVQRQERLLAEYEKKNRALQNNHDAMEAELTDATQLLKEVEDQLQGAEGALKEATAERDETIAGLRDEVDSLRQDLEATQEERAELAKQNEKNEKARRELEVTTDEMRSEIEGLKQRLRLAKKRVRDAEGDDEAEAQIAELQQQLDDQIAEVARLKEANDELHDELGSARTQVHKAITIPNGDEGPRLDAIAEHARTLDRVVDAIERTDLSHLSTVDRVRLQSAIREAQPRQTLSAMLELVAPED